MSYLIALGSPKSDRAVRFGLELGRAMKARKVGTRTLAAGGFGRTAVMYWRTGRMLPRAATAERLAEALSWPRLRSLATELRTKACAIETCSAPFIDDSGSDNQRYCSNACRELAGKRVNGVRPAYRAAVAERALLAHRRAVEAFCRRCEPDGRCFAPECELRPVSPLPLAMKR